MTQKEKVFGFMQENMKIPMTAEEMAVMLSVPDEAMGEFLDILAELEQEGAVIRTKKNRYAVTNMLHMARGKFIGNERGFGFVETEEESGDIFIGTDHIGGALHGDMVLVKILVEAEGDKRCEGEIIKILHSAEHKVVGRMDIRGTSGFLIPINRRYAKDFFIPKNGLNGAKHNDMVVAELTKRSVGSANPEGKIVSVLGNVHKPGVDILSVVESRSIPYIFPREVLAAAEKAAEENMSSQSEKRLDLRDKIIITIDGDDAKDLDDAVHVKKLPNGNFELGVHIADVGHFVPQGGIIDKEAYRRGTSIYLADRVIPMLPEVLSNGVCSLNEGVERFTLSVIMEIDRSGGVVDHKMAESVICSKRRMTYTNVTAILKGDREKQERFSDILPMVKEMEELRNILRKKRESRGSIDFNFDEARIILDDQGTPVEIVKRERSISNSIIEEFMLVCNETVAEHMFWLNLPLIYRVHEEPDTDAVKEFVKFIQPFGYTMKHAGGKVHPRELAMLLREISGKKEEMIISNVALRSLMKAHYSDENLGHFGLAATYYCHFTSPIRRYPDLAIHRMIKEHLNGKIPGNDMAEFAKSAAKQSSERELEAVDVERTVEDMKKAEYMYERLGDVYDAVLVSITSFGMFAALDNTIEGMIRLSDMADDYYLYDDEQKTVTGERNGKVYRVGDRVSVQVARVDVSAGKIDFVLYQGEDFYGQARKKAFLDRQRKQITERKKGRVKTARYLKKKRKVRNR